MSKYAKNYYGYIEEQAQELFDDRKEDFEAELQDGEVDIYSFFQEDALQWTDNEFIYVDLLDAATIIDESDNEESDSGLWEGQEPKDAIKTMAFYTFYNDIMDGLKDSVLSYLEEAKVDAERKVDELEYKQTELENELDEEDDDDRIDILNNEIEQIIDRLDEARSLLDNIEGMIK